MRTMKWSPHNGCGRAVLPPARMLGINHPDAGHLARGPGVTYDHLGVN
jgi:hypothetical protein